jgi:SH3-like domain-containing protein
VKNLPPYRPLAIALLVGALTGLLAITGCNRGKGHIQEYAYVSAPQANLRDRVAAVYNKTGYVKNGERVGILDRDRRFARVRTSSGIEGWIEQRFLVKQEVFDQIEKLTRDHQNDPVQSPGTTRNDTNLHLEPGRDAEHLYQISAGEKVSVLERGTAEKPGAVAGPARGAKADENKTPAPVIEDWWLVRDSHGRVGWVLARLVDLDVPLEIAQYAEGQRFAAFFVLNQVQGHGDKKFSQYLAVLTEPKDGLPFDFNQIRVFTWNVKRDRYETAFRERMQGVLPVRVSQENFEKEGALPVFVIRVKDDRGNVTERKYKLDTPIVRRVLAPGEVPTPATRKSKRKR